MNRVALALAACLIGPGAWAQPSPTIGSYSQTTATGSTTARALGDRAADINYNVKDYGAVLNGVISDSAAFQSIYSTAASGSTIRLPTGNLGAAAFTPVVGKSVLWNMLGTLDYGTSSAGTNPVTSFGDGDVTAGFYAGRYNFHKTITSSTNGYSVLSVDLTNASASQFGTGSVVAGLRVSAESKAGASGYTWASNCVLTAGATGGNTSQDVCYASTVRRTGAGATWQFFGQTIDTTGLAPNSPSAIVGFENDIASNGPEAASTVYNPQTGGRVFYNMIGTANAPPSWLASTAYSVGTSVVPSPSNGFTYVVTVAGTTASTQPVWPTSAGTVTDGTVTWQYGTTVANQISRGFSVATDASTQMGAAFSVSGTYYDAILDASLATFSGATTAAIRIPANSPIDLSGDGTLAGQNVHTLAYKSTGTALTYAKSGTPIMTVTDAGSATFTGSGNSLALAVANTQAGGHTYQLQATGGSSGFPSAFGLLDTTTSIRSLTVNNANTIGLGGSITSSTALTGAGITITSAGATKVNGVLTAVASVVLAQATVATLPACNSGLKGAFYSVTDATSPTYNGTLTGGGAVDVPVFCNGTAWTSH